MILSDVVSIALSIIGFLLSLQGLWLVCLALWPKRVELAAQSVQNRRGVNFWVGLVVTGILLAVGTGVSKAGAPGKLVAFFILLFYVMFSGVGTAGLITHIGRRLESPADAGRPWRATVRGGVVLELAYLIPVLGWFGILPISLIIGAGAATLAAFTRTERRPSPSISPSPARNENELPHLQPHGAL
jgi:hypothetical protein